MYIYICIGGRNSSRKYHINYTEDEITVEVFHELHTHTHIYIYIYIYICIYI